ncbi:3-dehydroquinate synthase [bacterium]|nr:3-dehydroquinate synthase [bacterium]
MKTEIINLKIEGKTREYPIIIGSNILNEVFNYIEKYTKSKKYLVVTNTTVKKMYGKFFERENVFFVVLDDGEIFKNIRSYEKILDKACEIGLERKDAIIALGGGVVGDMAGFAAATYLRGIDFVQVPTTLLAMVDSSVGGKTGFNNRFGKNLIGAFYQPKLVFTDINTLKTLDKKQLASGFGEVLKYGFIEKNCGLLRDINFASFLLENTDKILANDEEIMIKIIKTCCELKAAVVRADEKESGKRRILNFGHTIGHGIEKALDFKRITHGQAVVLGMKIMFNYSVARKIIDDMYRVNAYKLMDILSPIEDIPKINVSTVKKAMTHDKKNENNKINFIIPVSKREVEITEKIDMNILEEEIVKFFTNR